MIELKNTVDLELVAEDGFVFVMDGWNVVENRYLTDDEMQYLQEKYPEDLYAMAYASR